MQIRTLKNCYFIKKSLSLPNFLSRMLKYHLSIFVIFTSLLFISCGPSKVEQLRAEKEKRDSIQYLQTQNTIHYSDSMLLLLQAQADSLLTIFKYEKDDKYEEQGQFIHPRLRLPLNASRNYLQAYVRDDSRLCVRACYYGTSPLNLSAVNLEADSATIRLNGISHTFQVDAYHEWLNLTERDALQLLRFIAEYASYKIEVTLQGAWKTRFVLSEQDKQALLDTYHLSLLMKDIQQLERTINISNRKTIKLSQKHQNSD